MRHAVPPALGIAALGIIAALALSGCQNPTPISANPLQTVAGKVLPAGGTVVTGLQGAAYNLDQAILIGILPKTDPADACVHGALQQIGQDTGQAAVPPAPSFVPKVTDLLSAGSVAYILAAQAKTLAAGGVGSIVPQSCETIVGHFVLTGVNAPATSVINAIVGALP